MISSKTLITGRRMNPGGWVQKPGAVIAAARRDGAARL
jgi:hypothetical protein